MSKREEMISMGMVWSVFEQQAKHITELYQAKSLKSTGWSDVHATVGRIIVEELYEAIKFMEVRVFGAVVSRVEGYKIVLPEDDAARFRNAILRPILDRTTS